MSQSPIPPKQSEFSTPTSKSSIMNTQSKKGDDEPVATLFSGENNDQLITKELKIRGWKESWKDPIGEISESSSIEVLTGKLIKVEED
ncbi:hypothetical protein PPACK8108_LOCUS12476 [Phakopsora pachyrhizi]|uniref:Uncharacterized protein n=1 Tax=Phakopsora pachyrhizi TaxID=170000 RepID=A0AAV0B1V9_PHAPC|nr:hypothetical protein PPACK8108_LOCUS12476 [Phakopsora pachyrhizi]